MIEPRAFFCLGRFKEMIEIPLDNFSKMHSFPAVVENRRRPNIFNIREREFLPLNNKCRIVFVYKDLEVRGKLGEKIIRMDFGQDLRRMKRVSLI